MFHVITAAVFCHVALSMIGVCQAATQDAEKRPKQEVQPLNEANWTAIMEPGTEWMVAFVCEAAFSLDSWNFYSLKNWPDSDSFGL